MEAHGHLELAVCFEQTLVELRFLQHLIKLLLFAVSRYREEVREFQYLVDCDLVRVDSHWGLTKWTLKCFRQLLGWRIIALRSWWHWALPLYLSIDLWQFHAWDCYYQFSSPSLNYNLFPTSKASFRLYLPCNLYVTAHEKPKCVIFPIYLEVKDPTFQFLSGIIQKMISYLLHCTMNIILDLLRHRQQVFLCHQMHGYVGLKARGAIV